MRRLRTALRAHSHAAATCRNYASIVRDASAMLQEHPSHWYPAARECGPRRLFLHVGPTNSGKTHSALQALLRAHSGMYCAPLRLLAWEASDRANAAGVPCNLVTGQERTEIEGARHVACTVEMADVGTYHDVAVVDEIQLLGDPHRGWAFTRALLGLCVSELHLCGDPAAVPLVKRLVEQCGDTLEVVTYSRLLPLRVTKTPVSVDDVAAGDAFVAFSRRDVHALRNVVEEETKHRCAIVYGGLPPEARTAQAQLFNNARGKSGCSVLAASDAIGMGLNLSIGRVVFSTLQKFDGTSRRHLNAAEIRQIAGRAGRYGSKFDEGLVSAMASDGSCVELEHLRLALAQAPVPVPTAGIFPLPEHIERIAALHPRHGLCGALWAFASVTPPPDFHLRSMEDVIAAAGHVAPLGLPLRTQLTLALSPVDTGQPAALAALLAFARNLAASGVVPLVAAGGSMPSMTRLPRTQAELASLEEGSQICDLYIWLAARMPEAFPEVEVARTMRSAIGVAIMEGLHLLARPPATRAKAKAQAKAAQSAFDAATQAVAVALAETEAMSPRSGFGAWQSYTSSVREAKQHAQAVEKGAGRSGANAISVLTSL